MRWLEVSMDVVTIIGLIVLAGYAIAFAKWLVFA